MGKTLLKRHEEMEADAEHIIYNDLPSSLLFPISSTGYKFNQSVAEGLMEKGEEYIQLKGNGHFILTSYGRFINTHTVKQLKPAASSKSFLLYVDKECIKSSTVFETMGWEHNMDKMIERYKERGWKYLRPRYLREKGIT